MTKSLHKVSVVLCTYNGEKYIREQLNSVLSQTYPIYEIVIQDDCSCDSTWEIVKEYENRFPDLVHCYRNDTNMFWIQNFYSAIMKSKGDFVALCDQDDVWLPKKIEKQVLSIGDNLLCVCSGWYWTEKQSVPLLSMRTTPMKEFVYPHYSLHNMIVSREMVDAYIPLGQRIGMPCDTFMAQLALCLNRCVAIPDLMVRWRRHDGTATGEVVAEKNSRRAKVRNCVSSLLARKKSKNISIGVERYAVLYEWLKMNKKGGQRYKKMVDLMCHLKKQTLWDYICAGVIFVSIRDEIWGYKGFNLRQYYSAFTFPFSWWYLMKDVF